MGPYGKPVTRWRSTRPRLRAAELVRVERAFDRLVPPDVQYLARTHWTPIEIAIRAASLLCPEDNTRVLDVGAGIGKLCTIGALSGRGFWCGVEQHEPLVRIADRIARQLGAGDRTTFIHDDAFAIDWRAFDAVYLYNPFEFRLAPSADSDPTVDYQERARRVCELLAGLAHGTRVVTLNGFGGVIPAGYELAYHERITAFDLDLVLWIKAARSRETEPV
jgi:hypothetical protein